MIRKRTGKLRRGICFVPGDSWMHSLDPRTKLFMMLAISFASLFTESPLPMLLLLISVIALVLLSGIMKQWLHALMVMLPLLVCVFVLDSLFTHISGEIYFTADLWFLKAALSSGGIIFSTAMVIRLLVIGGISFLFVMTTSYNDFIRGLKCLGMPNIITFSLGYGLRSTSSLSQDAHNIMDAQRSRGMEFGSRSVLKNLNRLMALFIPMTISVLNRSHQVSDAMQCRGFGSAKRPGCYRPPEFGRPDLIMVLASLLILLLFAYICL